MPFEIPDAFKYIPEPAAAPAAAVVTSKAAPKGKAPPVKVAPKPAPRPEELAPMGVIVTYVAEDTGQVRPIQGFNASPVRGGVIFHRTICANLTCSYEAGYVDDTALKTQKFLTDGVATDRMKIAAKSYKALDDAEAAIDFKLEPTPNSNFISIAELRKLPKVQPGE